MPCTACCFSCRRLSRELNGMSIVIMQAPTRGHREDELRVFYDDASPDKVSEGCQGVRGRGAG